MGFCEIEHIEDLLRLEVDHALALRAITEATAAIKNYANQQFELVENDELGMDGFELRSKLFLPELPVLKVISVVEDGKTLTEGEDYKLGRHGILYRLKGLNWADGYLNIVIKYNHGYATLPQEIVDVCARAASRVYQAGLRAEATDGIVGIGAYSLGDYSVNFSSEQSGGVGHGAMGVSGSRFLLPWEKELLDKYRNLNRIC